MDLTLFDDQTPIGILKGFSPLLHQLEADVVMPASARLHPRFGEFLLLETDSASALVGRVSRFQAAGQLVTEQGERYLADLVGANQEMPATVTRQLLRYTVKLHLLGKLSLHPKSGFEFSVGERGLIVMGRRVRRPSRPALEYLCNVELETGHSVVPLGHLTFGSDWEKDIEIRFSINRLKERRSFIFARAGYGKSNLTKYLISRLYAAPPEVGLLIIDPEGEYAFPDAQGRPGLVNVPGFENRLSVYTSRTPPAPYQHCRRGTPYVDFSDFPPQEIVTGFITPEKHDSVFANLLRGMPWEKWSALVELLERQGYRAPDQAIATLLEYTPPKKDNVSLAAIKNNLVPAMSRAHRAKSNLGKNLIQELREHRIVIVDTSLLPGEDGLAITGLLLRRIFSNNVRHFTDPTGQSVRCLALLEEAQTMLGDRNFDDRNIFVRWVKEGRKFGLGCILVTQQPGAISQQIISQGDNFFVLHLLNDIDLQILQRHNAHYTDDILGFIRNEPIRGNCYFWSSPSQPFVLPVRVASFEDVAQRPQPVAAEPTLPKDKPALPREPLFALVDEALARNPQVWVYPVGRLNGHEHPKHILFSVDYLKNAVLSLVDRDRKLKTLPAERPAFNEEFKALIEGRLKELGGKFGFAVLVGIKRPVCVLPDSKVRLADTKLPRPEIIDVDETL